MDANVKKTVLVVEDEYALTKILSDILSKENFTVLKAENGKEGVTIALSNHPDLVLLDILMPVMDGMEALKKIRSDPWGAKVPVIILTNLSATKEDLIKNLISQRPAYYLIKTDWKIQEVVEKIKDVLKV